MTPELQNRFLASLAPFNGRTILLCDDPPPEDVLFAIQQVAAILGIHYRTILRFEDWHEHDGFLTNPTVIDWTQQTECWRDLDFWFKTSPVDDYVRTAIYSPTFDWLLRCGLYKFNDSEGLDDAWPYLDFTATLDSPANQAFDRIRELLSGCTRLDSPMTHFQACYAG
jgi:hypothetical protein